MKKKIIDFLKSVQKIIESEGENDFSELRKRKREEIIRLFVRSFPNYKTDGDTDGCCIFISEKFNDTKCVIMFNANCYNMDDFLGMAHSMEIYIYSDNSNIDIDGIIPVLTFLESLTENNTPLALLNTSILTTSGSYTLDDITLEDAIDLVNRNADNLDSAIGHDSTAEIMTTLLGVDIPVNRQMFSQDIGQQALVFKLNGRPEEGRILTADEIKQIGYKFQLLTRNA